MNLLNPLHLGLRLTFSKLLALPLALALPLTLALAACGDSGTAETTAGPTTAATDTNPTTATGTGTGTDTNPTTTPDLTTGSAGQTDSGTSTGPDPTATGTTANPSTGPDTTATGTTADPQTTADTSDTGNSSGTTGGDDFIPCETDKDCTLIDGCCDCDVINVMQTPPACDVPECFATTCSTHGLDTAAVECRFGRCTFAKVQCNPLGVNCKSKPPVCPVGQVPGVEDTNDGKCWTGFCVYAEACDWVPDCTHCAADDLVCVGKLQKGAYHLCEPRPADCEGTGDIDCDCGMQICDASPPHTVCHDAQPGIECECPNC